MKHYSNEITVYAVYTFYCNAPHALTLRSWERELLHCKLTELGGNGPKLDHRHGGNFKKSPRRCNKSVTNFKYVYIMHFLMKRSNEIAF
jgi:hypothetical protein